MQDMSGLIPTRGTKLFIEMFQGIYFQKYFVQTRSQTNTSGTVLPKLHRIGKGVDPNSRPEKQVIKPLSALV